MWNNFTKNVQWTAFQGLAAVRPPGKGPLPSQPRVIAVFACTGIGDGLFDSAAIRCLKLGFPQAHLAVIAHHRRMTIAQHNPFVDEVLPWSKSPLGQARLLGAFRRKRPDLVVALRVNQDTVPMGYLLNRNNFVASVRHAGMFQFLVSHPVVSTTKVHAVEETLIVAREAGGLTEAPSSMIYQVLPEEREAARQRFQPWIEKPFLTWQVGGGKNLAYRDYPAEKIIAVIQQIQKQSNLQVVITGGPDNDEAAARVTHQCPGLVNLCSQTTLEETAAVVERSQLLVSSDTGVMHLGFALGTPTLALLHPRSRPERYGPPSDEPQHQVIALPAQDATGKILSMKDLPTETVIEAIMRRVCP